MLLTEAEFDACFDDARFEAFRLEALSAYAVPVETPRFRSYLAGEPYDPEAEPAAWYDYIRERTAAGVTFRKVRMLKGPLSEYERWECEWSYTATERVGQRTHVIDLAEMTAPDELPSYDWWMFDRASVVRMHYGDGGEFIGAERLGDEVVLRHVRWRDEAVAAAVSFPDYWDAHPQYWRQNWSAAPGGS
ncbi:DUF6879 family protein [Embleya sp. MST-111070]|uniref:DUF6879 family protein n=1 Tax=Embleya sp. MST-111070 TaxID=3398231 RepID=UPI003F741BC8